MSLSNTSSMSLKISPVKHTNKDTCKYSSLTFSNNFVTEKYLTLCMYNYLLDSVDHMVVGHNMIAMVGHSHTKLNLPSHVQDPIASHFLDSNEPCMKVKLT